MNIYAISIIYAMIYNIVWNTTIDYVKTSDGCKATTTPWEIIVEIFDIDDDTGKPMSFAWYQGQNIVDAIKAYRNDGHYKADDISVLINGRYEHEISEALRKLANMDDQSSYDGQPLIHFSNRKLKEILNGRHPVN